MYAPSRVQSHELSIVTSRVTSARVREKSLPRRRRTGRVRSMRPALPPFAALASARFSLRDLRRGMMTADPLAKGASLATVAYSGVGGLGLSSPGSSPLEELTSD